MRIRTLGAGFAALAMIGGLAACGTKTSSTSTPAVPVSSKAPDQSTVNRAIIIQADVCTLMGEGYSQGEIIDAVAQYGYSGSDVAGIIAAAAANCPTG